MPPIIQYDTANSPGNLATRQGQIQSQFAAQQFPREQALQAQNIAGENYRANLPWNFKQGIFNKVFPMVQSAFGRFMGGPGGAGAPFGGGPGLPPSSVLNGQQTNELVNQATSANDQTAAGNIRQAGAQLAGRGMGANSPLYNALAGQQQAAALGANSQARSSIPIDVAQKNAAQSLGVGGLANQQYLGQLNAFTSTNNALLAALAGMV